MVVVVSVGGRGVSDFACLEADPLSVCSFLDVLLCLCGGGGGFAWGIVGLSW
jgi:hypothetical protein